MWLIIKNGCVKTHVCGHSATHIEVVPPNKLPTSVGIIIIIFLIFLFFYFFCYHSWMGRGEVVMNVYLVEDSHEAYH